MSLQAVRKHLQTADKALTQGDTAKAQEAVALAMNSLVGLMNSEKLPAASQLGRLGGTVTAKRGPDYFRELAARRKTYGGGRPRKETE
jgi:hypothetical protein